jgi:hypothetical protein
LRGVGFKSITFLFETIYTDKLKDTKGRTMPTMRAVALIEGYRVTPPSPTQKFVTLPIFLA